MVRARVAEGRRLRLGGGQRADDDAVIVLDPDEAGSCDRDQHQSSFDSVISLPHPRMASRHQNISE